MNILGQIPVSQKTVTWNTQLVLSSIKELVGKGQPISLRSMRIYERADPDPLLTSFHNHPTSRQLLYHVGCHFFGSWDKAVQAAGFQPRKHSFNRFWNKSRITLAIQALSREGHPLNVTFIYRDRSRRTTEIISETIGKQTTGAGLHDAARRYFGTWDKALQESGIDLDLIKEKPFWTKRKILLAISDIHTAGVPLNSANMDKNTSEAVSNIIKQRFGKRRDGRSLFASAYNTFGSWDRALTEANLDPNDFRKTKFRWNKRGIARTIKRLHNAGVRINSANLSQDNSLETSLLIHDLVGRHATGSSIFRLGCKKLGSWNQAIRFAGFNLSSIRRRSTACGRNQDKVIDVIRWLNKNDFLLNYTNLLRESQKLRPLNEIVFDQDISGGSLISAGKSIFGSWDQTLWNSGLDPSSIRRSSRPHSSALPVILAQVEAGKSSDGEYRKNLLQGAPPKSPEQIMEDNESRMSLEAAIEHLDEGDQEILEEIFDSILRIHHYKDQSQLITFISQDLGGQVSKEKIAALFVKVAGHIEDSGFRL